MHSNSVLILIELFSQKIAFPDKLFHVWNLPFIKHLFWDILKFLTICIDTLVRWIWNEVENFVIDWIRNSAVSSSTSVFQLLPIISPLGKKQQDDFLNKVPTVPFGIRDRWGMSGERRESIVYHKLCRDCRTSSEAIGSRCHMTHQRASSVDQYLLYHQIISIENVIWIENLWDKWEKGRQ